MFAPPRVEDAAGVTVVVAPHKMTGNRDAGVPGYDTLGPPGAGLMRLKQVECARLWQFLSPH